MLEADGPRPSIVFVLFIGGITFAETAAIRYTYSHSHICLLVYLVLIAILVSASRFLQEQKGVSYIIGATQLINGNTLLDTIIEQ